VGAAPERIDPAREGEDAERALRSLELLALKKFLEYATSSAVCGCRRNIVSHRLNPPLPRRIFLREPSPNAEQFIKLSSCKGVCR
jgi:hypothetical protein